MRNRPEVEKLKGETERKRGKETERKRDGERKKPMAQISTRQQ